MRAKNLCRKEGMKANSFEKVGGKQGRLVYDKVIYFFILSDV